MSNSSKIAQDELATQEDNATFEEVNNHIEEAFRILKNENLKLRKEREAFDGATKKLERVHFSKTLKLNVGGQLFSTSLETITKDPGSMLHVMFSGRFDTKLGEDGSFFIDRDGTHFRFILNYLRTGRLLLPDDKLVREELLEEAEFYKIQGIIDELTPPFEESTILSAPQRETLRGWLKTSTSNSSLIYRAFRDGWAAANFHRSCDGRGPTVTVIRSSDNFLFGGYTEQPWDISGRCKRDPNAFLFSLVNQSGSEPTRINLIQGREESAILCNRSYGPVFGYQATVNQTPPHSFRFGMSTSGMETVVPVEYDLLIGGNPSESGRCQSCLNHSFQCPAGQNASTFLAGSTHFTASEIEVFVLKT